MVGIIIFMIIALFSYTIFLKYYNEISCPKCNSNKIITEELLHYKMFTCKNCKFSYRDYFSFYFLTPISEDFEVYFAQSNEEDDHK